MLRRCCMILVLILTLCAAAQAQTSLTLKTDEIRCYGENTLTLTAPQAGTAVILVRDKRDQVCRALTAAVEKGANRLTWNGLGENDEPLASGTYTISVSLNGEETSVAVRTKKSVQALAFAVPSSPVLYLGGGEKWFVEVKLVRAGNVVMEIASAAAPEVTLLRRRQRLSSDGVFTWSWNGGKTAPGDYIVRCWAEENPAYAVSFDLTLASGTAPEMQVSATGEVMPASLSDADVWAAMMQPSVVCDLKNNTDHQNVYVQPMLSAPVAGTIHGQSQAVEVLALCGADWAQVAAWNHESGSRIIGYVPLNVLKTVTPNPEYGILINKQEQTMTVYHRGSPLGTVPVSTGLMAEKKLIRETPAGAFFTVERIKAFDDGGYHYRYPIRYDGGNLIHAIGSRKTGEAADYAEQTATLGQKASHGCIRVPVQPGEGGLNAYWLWTHIPYHTRVLILDDPAQRQERAKELGVTLTDAGISRSVEDLPVRTGQAPVSDDVLTLTLGGDAVLGVRENWWRREEALPAYLERYGMVYPFSGLHDVFASDDMTLVNLECVLKADRAGEQTRKAYRFRGLPAWTSILTEGSVEQVNIANNHYIDYDAAGKKATRMALNAGGVPFSGYTFTYVWEKNGHRIGFAGCRETMFARDKSLIAKEVKALRGQGCEVVIYSCHWGVEYEPRHNAVQMEMARAAAEAGVDLIVGTHPHVVQGLAEVDGMPVLWSLGNLVFGGTIDLTTFDAALARAELVFVDGRYAGVQIRMIPILTSGRAAEGINDYRPVAAEGEDAARIMEKIQADTDFRLEGPVWFPAK